MNPRKHRRPEVQGLRQLLAGVEHPEALRRPTEAGQGCALGHEGVRDHDAQVGVFRGLQDPVGDLDGSLVVVTEEVRPGKLAAEGDDRRVGREIGEPGGSGFQEPDDVGGAPRRVEGTSQGGDGASDGRTVAQIASECQCGPQVTLGGLVAPRGGRRVARTLQHVGPIGGLRGHGQSLLPEAERLLVGTQGGGTLGGGPQGDPGLGGEGIRLRTLGCVLACSQVVAREGTYQFIGAETLEEVGRGEVTDLAVALGEGVVGDLPDEGLHESVLAPLRRAGIGLVGQQLPAHQRPEPRFQGGRVDARYGAETGRREALAQNGGIEHQRAVRGVEAVEARRDERGERLGDGEGREVTDGGVGAVAAGGQAALGEQHPHRLDGIERHAVGPRDDGADCGLRQPRHETHQQLPHGLGSQGLQVQAREVASTGTPVGPPVQQLRSSEGDDVEGGRAAPLEQVVDEVDGAGIGPVEVLEHHHDRSCGRQSLEEGAPGPEQLVGADARVDAQECQQRRLDPAPLQVGQGQRVELGGDGGPGGALVVGLGQACPFPDHLAERPEADARAVCGGAAPVPPRRVHEAVEVLLELPGDAALADAPDAGHRHEACPAIPRGGVEQVLEQALLIVPPDEGGLQGVGAIPSAHLGHDPQGTPRGHRRGLALERLLARGLERDGCGCGALGRLAHEHRAGAAADCSLAAVLTRSPATMPWLVAPSVTVASPVSTAARALMPGPSVRISSTSSRAARTDRSASSSRATGAPHTAMTASPMNFSTTPP